MLWNDIVKTALIGSEKQPLVLSLDILPTDMLARLDGHDPEGKLLGATAVLALYNRAGWMPLHQPQTLPATCDLDDLPRCSPRAGQHLATILGGQYAQVLPEWLQSAATVGVRASEEHLPALLEIGRKQEQHRAAILLVLGKRGRWLAAQNPAWEYAQDMSTWDVTTVWQTGNKAAREMLLNWLRATDPGRARELLASTWSTEATRNRTAFLQMLATGLSMDDEPFLEAALDDRSKEVREKAAHLLSHLPASRLVQRMIARVQPLLKFQKGGLLKLKRSRIEVTLPEECDPAMQRDAIDSPRHASLGEKAGWLQQMLSAIPPSFWTTTWEISPIELIRLVAQTEWSELFMQAWQQSTLRHHDMTWAADLILCNPEGAEPLLRMLLPEHREALLLHMLRSRNDPLDRSHPAFQPLSHAEHIWSTELSRMVLESIRLQITRNKVYDSILYGAVQRYALFLSPDLADEAARGWPTDAERWYWWEKDIQAMIATLQFRHQMLQALQS